MRLVVRSDGFTAYGVFFRVRLLQYSWRRSRAWTLTSLFPSAPKYLYLLHGVLRPVSPLGHLGTALAPSFAPRGQRQTFSDTSFTFVRSLLTAYDPLGSTLHEVEFP